MFIYEGTKKIILEKIFLYLYMGEPHHSKTPPMEHGGKPNHFFPSFRYDTSIS